MGSGAAVILADSFRGNLLLDSPYHSFLYFRNDHRADYGARQNVKYETIEMGVQRICISGARHSSSRSIVHHFLSVPDL